MELRKLKFRNEPKLGGQAVERSLFGSEIPAKTEHQHEYSGLVVWMASMRLVASIEYESTPSNLEARIKMPKPASEW